MPAVAMDESDVEALDQIAHLWDVLDLVDIDRARVNVLPGSDFQSDQTAVPQYIISGQALNLIVTGRDHLLALRDLTRAAPEGFGMWYMYAPWTLLRSALEHCSQSVWLAHPDSQQERMEHLLRLSYEDYRQNGEAQVLAVRPRDREKAAALVGRWKATFDTIAAPWEDDAVTGRRMRTPMSMSECVEFAAKASGAASPFVAHLLWRIASGYSHGRSWASHYTTTVRDLDGKDGPSTGRKINYKDVLAFIGLTLEVLNYAVHIVQVRSGYPSRFETTGHIPPVPYLRLPKS